MVIINSGAVLSPVSAFILLGISISALIYSILLIISVIIKGE
nr:MAG TPA: hypothetical protein [Caudoviricetes sp.]